jgi:hypothetical protein
MMAEYIKFRLSAAKAGVTLAFFALLGGLIGPAEGREGGPTAQPASFSFGAHYLKLDGLNFATQKVFQKLENKLNSAFLTLNHKLTSDFYDKHKIDATFLKIKTANSEFLKIRSANANFLKITDANTNFLKITDANAKFLKIDGTAADSKKLGGLTPDAFVQGRGGVISGAVTVNGDGKSAPLLQLPGTNGAIIAVLVALDQASGQPVVTVHNGTGSLLPAVQTVDGSVTPANLQPGDNTLQIGVRTTTHELTLQIFPNAAAGFNDAVSILIGLEPNPLNNNNQYSAVGQMLIGLL